jgi:hypothetical protein
MWIAQRCGRGRDKQPDARHLAHLLRAYGEGLRNRKEQRTPAIASFTSLEVREMSKISVLNSHHMALLHGNAPKRTKDGFGS